MRTDSNALVHSNGHSRKSVGRSFEFEEPRPDEKYLLTSTWSWYAPRDLNPEPTD
jgi:hypothetical protein